jgi:hypothetical protein
VRERITKAELVARQHELPALQAALAANEAQRSALYEEWQELRRLTEELSRVDEVFEGAPLDLHDSGNRFQVHGLGEDDFAISAYVNPVDPPDEEISEDPDVPIPFRGWLLQLSGAGARVTKSHWKLYPPDQRAVAVLAAKRFVAHGVVPIPDAAKE